MTATTTRPVDVGALYRVDANRFDSVEYRKIERRHGASGVLCLEKLLAYVRRFRPDGTLTGMDDEAVAIASDWDGDASQFVTLLLELALLSRSDGDQSLSVVGWSELNQWAAEAGGRSEHARLMNHNKWHRDRGRSEASCSFCNSVNDSSMTSDGNPTDISGRSDGESKKKGKESKEESQNPFEDSSVQVQLATAMVALIRERDPKFKTPNMQRWAADIDAMIRLDNRTPEEIGDVLTFAFRQSFRTDILRPSKLRQHFTALMGERSKLAEKGKAKNGNGRSEQITDPQLRSITERHEGGPHA